MKFEAVIGLEIHAQMSTKTKLFCSCDNDSFGKTPNTNVCPICMSFPGMLPVLNKEAVKKGVKAALALNCSIQHFSKFDRKNYFYPDLPSGYQISQFDEPIAEHGFIEVEKGNDKLKIRINRLHIENDAGKLSHSKEHTLLDFNRAGTPLMEIVSEPDLHSAEDARKVAEMIQKILRTTESSDCDMEKGMMRFDASVSIRPAGETKLYPRAEIKNLNSFKSLEAAITYEIERQTELWESGEPQQTEQTVGWDEESQVTKILREKESAADYRYFPEPDLPPVKVTDEEINNWKNEISELPQEKLERFKKDYELKDADAAFYAENPEIATYFELVVKASGNVALSNSFVSTILVAHLKEKTISIDQSPITAQNLAKLLKLIDEGVISNTTAKSTVFESMWETKKDPEALVEELGLKQVSDSSFIEDICKEALASNPQSVADYKAGKTQALGALIGHVMKKSQGKANPKMVNDILLKILL